MARAAITNPAALLVAGASLMLIDHYDRTYLLTKDLQDYVNYLRGQRMCAADPVRMAAAHGHAALTSG